MAVNRHDIGSFIFVLLKAARKMNESEKIEHNKKFILRYAAAMNSLGTAAGVEETVRKFADNESYIRGVIAFRNAFPDYSIFIEDITAEGDFVIVHGVFRGTHKGEIFGIPATHRKVEYPMMVKYHVVNDRILNAWPMHDSMELFEQLGVINKPV
jgi:predicted ester cyclase